MLIFLPKACQFFIYRENLPENRMYIPCLERKGIARENSITTDSGWIDSSGTPK